MQWYNFFSFMVELFEDRDRNDRNDQIGAYLARCPAVYFEMPSGVQMEIREELYCR